MHPSRPYCAITQEKAPSSKDNPPLFQLHGFLDLPSSYRFGSWAKILVHKSFLRFFTTSRPWAELYGSRTRLDKTSSDIDTPSRIPESSLGEKRSVEGDGDGDGGVGVCRSDVEMVMGKLGLFCSHDDKGEELYRDRRLMSGGEISRLFEEEAPGMEEVKEAFYVFDVNRDGFIDAKELQRVLMVLGFSKVGGEVEDCERMIRVFDENGDGRIDFKEFVGLMGKCLC